MNPLLIFKEAGRVSYQATKHWLFGMSFEFKDLLSNNPHYLLKIDEKTLGELVGNVIMSLFTELGPVYGKAGQMALSRLGGRFLNISEALHLTRLYNEWPAMSSEDLFDILDEQVPGWRDEFEIDRSPLGVASIGQVHRAVDRSGKQWAIKVLKPRAVERLFQTLEAFEEILKSLEALPFSKTLERTTRELNILIESFKTEADLSHEAKTIEKFLEKKPESWGGVLRVPEVWGRYSTKSALCIEYFEGVSLAKVVSGERKISAQQKKKLAKKILKELLIQVFEVGLFHADPHAGNLILMEDGSVGLFDWGLSGELSDEDKQFVSSILRAVISIDLDGLIDALYDFAHKQGQDNLSKDTIRKELNKFIKLAKTKGDNQDKKTKPRLDQLLNAALEGAERMNLRVPEGLLLMAKSLLTIEGLSKGIDPEVSFKLIAAPVLLKASKMRMSDYFSMTRRVIEKKLGL